MLVAWIVGRVHVGEFERTHPVHLYDCRSLGPRKMMHPRRHPHEASRVDKLTFGRIESIAHPGTEGAADNGHVLIGRMPMRPKLATVGEFEPHGEGSALLEGVSVEDCGLRALGNHRRRWTPFEVPARRHNMDRRRRGL